MKLRKTMTARALQANQQNAQQSTGPRNTDATRMNAVTHGLLTKKVSFESDEDKQTFDLTVEELTRCHAPVGFTEKALVVEAATALWRLRELNGWEFAELSTRQKASATILQGLQDSWEAQQLPLLSAAQQGWQPQALVVRTGNKRTVEEEDDASSDQMADKTGHVIIEAKLANPIDVILRYGAAIKRDYYRALAALRELQRERLELEGLIPSNPEVSDDQN